MVEILNEINLDLNKNKLYGHERPKRASKVAKYIKMNLSGSVPPKTEVIYKNGIYQIVYGRKKDSSGLDFANDTYNYAGHNRAIAHWISGHKLGCVLLDGHRASPPLEFFPVKDIALRTLSCERGNIRDFLEEASENIFSRFVEMCDNHEDYSPLIDTLQNCEIKNKFKNYLNKIPFKNAKEFCEKHDFNIEDLVQSL
ncbi:hypothetical protein ACFLTE_07120 [Bacteroidota bacterium]